MLTRVLVAIAYLIVPIPQRIQSDIKIPNALTLLPPCSILVIFSHDDSALRRVSATTATWFEERAAIVS